MALKNPNQLADSILNDKKMFFGRPMNTEDADDMLFALQAMYGNPKLNYEEAAKKYTQQDADEAFNYVKNKGFNKFTYFNGKPYGD